MSLSYLSICSGIEAATVSWHPLGWNPAGFAEIEKFPSLVLQHHFPQVKNYGDFTQIQADDISPIDLLVGGTPCQDFSVAGLRAGLAGERGQLTIEFTRLAARLRPRWLVWENVPGVLSDDGGRSFGLFLGLLGQLGYGFAYRVLDAKFCGVPQRRRRVFVVGYLGDWRRAAAVLFERHGLSGYPAPSREAGENIAGCVTNRLGNGSETFPNLCADYGDKWGLGNQEAFRGGHHVITGGSFDVAPTLVSEGDAHSGFRDEPGLVPISIRTAQTSANGHGVAEDVSHTLDGAQGQAVCFDTTQISSPQNYSNPKIGDPCHPLASGAHPPAVANGMAVRRLTPLECERLQGFPDNFTKISAKTADGPRYKALGNSMAVPVMRWIGERIEMVDSL